MATYVITEACIGVKDATCVDVCPAACIHTTPDEPQFYIDPDVCIACEQCVIVCPVKAIYIDDEVPEHLRDYIEINAAFFRENKEAAPPLTLEQARAMLVAAQRYVRESGFEAAIAVVDPSGEPIATAESPGTAPETAQRALDKAYTAACLQVATHQLSRGATTRLNADGRFVQERLIEGGGGYPAVEGADVIGAIGVAGTPSAQTDLQACMAGLSALRPASGH